jgi:ketosteroid isomerase-like protein
MLPAVPETDVEIIRQAYEAWNSGEYERASEFLAPDVVVDASDRVMNPDVYHGHDGFRRLVEEVREVWEEWRIEPEEFIRCDHGVVVVARASARGRGSGVELDQVAYNVWKIRDGKVVRAAFFYDKDAAIREANVDGERTEADHEAMRRT